MSAQNEALLIDLAAIGAGAQNSGPQWGHSCDDLNLTLLSWERGRTVAPHVNNEVEVVIVVVDGEGEAIVNGETFRLAPGQALLIPKGVERAIQGTSIQGTAERFSYLSVHRRRQGLMPTLGGRPLVIEQPRKRSSSTPRRVT